VNAEQILECYWDVLGVDHVDPERRFVDPQFQTKTEKMVEFTQLMDNEVFMAFASYTTIVLSKMMFMSTATAFYRLTRKVFANPEDCAGFGKGENAKKYLRTDDRVERVR
ncbi:hypothetical protein E2I00_002657, partial [Balaenoptera physalus]